MALTKTTKGNCEFCERVAVDLFVQHGDMMCSECIAREAAVVTATRVIEVSRANDSAIELKSDVMQAATTSFIELSGAIHSNPAIADDQKKYALALEAVERIKKLDAVIFQKESDLMKDRNERMMWLKNTQELVATIAGLKADQRAKLAQYNMNYKPAPVTEVKVKKVAKAGKAPAEAWTESTPIGVKKPSNKQIKESCEAAGADVTMVSMMLASPKNASLTLSEVIQKFLAKLRS